MNKHNPISNTYRLLIVVGTIIIILFNTMKDQYALFILVVLVLLANMQVRNTLNKQSFFVLSIVVDCVFTFYLYSSFSYYAVLFLLVTLIDSLLRSNDKVYHLVLLISVTYGFSLNYVDRFDIGEIICLFYLFVLLFLVHLRKELNDKVEVESLNEK